LLHSREMGAKIYAPSDSRLFLPPPPPSPGRRERDDKKEMSSFPFPAEGKGQIGKHRFGAVRASREGRLFGMGRQKGSGFRRGSANASAFLGERVDPWTQKKLKRKSRRAASFHGEDDWESCLRGGPRDGREGRRSRRRRRSRGHFFPSAISGKFEARSASAHKHIYRRRRRRRWESMGALGRTVFHRLMRTFIHFFCPLLHEELGQSRPTPSLIWLFTRRNPHSFEEDETSTSISAVRFYRFSPPLFSHLPNGACVGEAKGQGGGGEFAPSAGKAPSQEQRKAVVKQRQNSGEPSTFCQRKNAERAKELRKEEEEEHNRHFQRAVCVSEWLPKTPSSSLCLR